MYMNLMGRFPGAYSLSEQIQLLHDEIIQRLRFEFQRA